MLVVIVMTGALALVVYVGVQIILHGFAWFFDNLHPITGLPHDGTTTLIPPFSSSNFHRLHTRIRLFPSPISSELRTIPKILHNFYCFGILNIFLSTYFVVCYDTALHPWVLASFRETRIDGPKYFTLTKDSDRVQVSSTGSSDEKGFGLEAFEGKV